jgi:hypothetical protein
MYKTVVAMLRRFSAMERAMIDLGRVSEETKGTLQIGTEAVLFPMPNG